MNIFCWINENSTLIQTFLGAFVAIIAGIYVLITYKLLHSPYRAYLKPCKISKHFDKELDSIDLHNYGPGTALNMKIQLSVIRRLIPVANKKKQLRFLIDTIESPASGPTELKSGDSGIFYFEGSFERKWPIYITWRTVTNKKEKSVWLASDNEIFIRIGICKRVFYRIKWLITNLSTPIVKLQVWFRKRQIKKEQDKNSNSE